MADNAKISDSGSASRPNGAATAGQKPRCPRGRVPEGNGDQMRGSRPARTAPERGHILPPKAGRPTYGNALPLRGLGIDRPAMIGVAIARERDAGGRLPSGRTSPAGTGRMAGHAARVGKRGCRRGKAIGLEWDDYREGRRPSRISSR